jgi:hypothetical protein
MDEGAGISESGGSWLYIYAWTTTGDEDRLALAPAKSERGSPETKPSIPKQRSYSAQQLAMPATSSTAQ